MTGVDARAKDLLLDALERPPGERAAFLETACRGDDSLRARVASLLTAHEAADDRVGTGPVVAAREASGPTAGGAADVAAPPGPGARVGPYELVELVGEGGFGSVFRAVQHEPVRRTVALKLVKLGMDTAAVIARFEAERQALALMDHPHIARVYDAGATELGRPYFVMEFVDGRDVVSFCDAHALTLERRLDLFVTVCEAIQHAHQKGVIHRDIKPGNVLVAVADGVPEPKVIDFGVAKATGMDLTDRTVLTGAGHVMGTPSSMSPEQIAGAADVDTRADVYALGVLLYELLAGEPPFILGEGGLVELQRRVREDDPVRPGAARRRAGRAGEVPEDLDWIVMRCLEKDRDRRYQSAADLAEDVERFLDQLPVEAAPPSRLYRLRKFVRRRSGVAAAAGLVAAAVVVGGVGVGLGFSEARRANAELDVALDAARYEAERAREAEAEARERTELALLQAEIAGAVRDFLEVDILGAAAPSGEPGLGRDARVRDALDVASRRLDASAAPGGRFHDKPLVEASIRAAVGDAYAALGLHDASEPHYRRAAALYDAQDGTAASANDVRRALGDVARRAGRTDEARALLEPAYAALAADPSTGVARRTLAASALGMVLAEQGEVEAAVGLLRDALAEAEAAGGPLDPTTLGCRSTLGLVLAADSRTAEAEPAFRAAWEGLRLVLGPRDPDTLASALNLANALRGLGRLDEAEPLYDETVAALVEVSGPDHPDTLAARHSLGRLLLDRGRYDEAITHFEELLPTAREVLGAAHEDALAIAGGLGRALELRGRLEEAEVVLRAALAEARASLPAADEARIARAQELSSVLLSRGRAGEAEALMREVHEGFAALAGPDHPRTLGALGNLAIAVLQRGGVEEAGRMFREVAEGMRRTAGPSAPGTLEAEANLVLYLVNTGSAAEAESLARGALERGREALDARSMDLVVLLMRHAVTLLAQDRLDEAEPLLREAHAVLEADYRAHFRTAEVYQNLGWVCAGTDREEEAEVWDARLAAWQEEFGGS